MIHTKFKKKTFVSSTYLMVLFLALSVKRLLYHPHLHHNWITLQDIVILSFIINMILLLFFIFFYYICSTKTTWKLILYLFNESLYCISLILLLNERKESERNSNKNTTTNNKNKKLSNNLPFSSRFLLKFLIRISPPYI